MSKKKKKEQIEIKLDRFLGTRIPTAKPTDWHKDKTKYSRKVKHKKSWR